MPCTVENLAAAAAHDAPRPRKEPVLSQIGAPALAGQSCRRLAVMFALCSGITAGCDEHVGVPPRPGTAETADQELSHPVLRGFFRQQTRPMLAMSFLIRGVTPRLGNRRAVSHFDPRESDPCRNRASLFRPTITDGRGRGRGKQRRQVVSERRKRRCWKRELRQEERQRKTNPAQAVPDRYPLSSRFIFFSAIFLSLGLSSTEIWRAEI